MEINIRDTRFISSSPALKGCPEPKLPEFAFIGRSNVGKSTLINMLTGQKKLAKVSSSPGKTKMIVHFLVNEEWYLVDLPGYGYAKVSKDQRSEFKQSIMEYIGKRKTLYCLFVLIDSRLSPQDVDIKFINWLGENEVAFTLVFTKTDKISSGELSHNVNEFEKKLKENWDVLPPKIFSSSVKKIGKDEILKHVFKILKGNVS